MASRLRLAQLVVFLFPLAVFILSLITARISPAGSILEEISSSLDDYPIVDFSYREDCREKHSESIYSFPGSVHGCSCINVFDYRDRQSGKYQINPGACNINQTINGCTDLPSIQETKIYLWGDGKFCSKKYNTGEFKFKGYLHFLENSVLENEECQKGYKKCGKLDDMGNYLCIKEEDECPINDIQVTFSDNEELERLNYSYIVVNNKYFYYTNKAKKPVISKLKVAEGGKVCFDKKLLYTQYPQYILDNNFMYYGCRHGIDGEIYAKDIQVLDYRTKKQIYRDSDINLNKIYSSSESDYPLYSLEANMSLYLQRYPGFDKKCLIENGVFDVDKTPFNQTLLDTSNQLIDELLSINTFIKWFSMSSFIILFLFSAGLNIMGKCQMWTWIILNCMLYIGMGVPIYINIAKFNSISEFPTCGNEVINTKINIYHSTRGKFKLTTILSIIFINLQLLFVIVMVIIRGFISRLLLDGNNYRIEGQLIG